MSTALIDLPQLVAGLADRRRGRTEANVQSDLHRLLTAAPFELEAGDLDNVVLESPAGQRLRIDVEVGQTVFEVKRDLRSAKVREAAEVQLAGYVRAREAAVDQRYVGVLTDGAEWHLYHLQDQDLVAISSFHVSHTAPDVDGLVVWLESVLATASRVTPNPHEILRRLGADSPAHKLDFADLAALYANNKDRPEVALKRELWAKLLTTALGTSFEDEDALFVEHSLLVATAEIIAHAVVGIDPRDPTVSAKALLGGALFQNAQIGGVVEPDFFDWVAEVPGGDRFVRGLARRLGRFAWDDVHHDVMKVLYESIINAATRHSLGEYYTPDWLANEIVEEAVQAPMDQRVMDPACGSGTFLFHSVRRYLESARAHGLTGPAALNGVTRNVVGVDVHPVAVTLARVTYLLAIGVELLRDAERPALAIPVYLGDSMQWGQEESLLTAQGLTVATADGAQLFADELKFPERLLSDAGRFDQLVAEMADKATDRRTDSAVPSLSGTFRRLAIHPDDQEVLLETFATMCRLNDQGRNHIWGYYVRNLARPIWLSHPANRVDVLVGNPPWIAYRFMPKAMQEAFRLMCQDRGMWGGASVATNQDLSGLFVARSAELYLRKGGSFAFVMPLAVLTRRQFAGFRTGMYAGKTLHTTLAFDQPWDLHAVKPAFFPVPAAVVFGRRGEAAIPLSNEAETWEGRLRAANASMATARETLSRHPRTQQVRSAALSPYAARFTQGATIVPRALLVVEEQPSTNLGVGAGRVSVRSLRSSKEKFPWKGLPSRTGAVERQFVRPLLLGDSLLPFLVRKTAAAIIPMDGGKLLDSKVDPLDQYPGLAAWWRQAEADWMRLRSNDSLSLLQQLNYRNKLAQQFPAPPHRVVYSASGMYLAAARLSDPAAVVEHAFYWGAAATVEEAQFLVGILNTETMTERVRPLQARGEHNPRHFDKYVWQVSIPLFDPTDPRHVELAALGAEAERLVTSLDLPEGIAFEAQRRRTRTAVITSPLGQALERLADELLASQTREVAASS